MPNTPVRAAAEGLPSINRRRALAVTGSGLTATLAGLAASTVKAPAASACVKPIPANPDAGLRPLVTAWRKARRMVEAYSRLHTAAEKRARAMRLPKPERGELSQEDIDAWKKLTVAELPNHRWPSEEAYQAAMAVWIEDCARIEEECGLVAAEAEWHGLIDLERDAAYAVLAFPVRTLDGLAAKFRVHAVYDFEATDFADQIARDVSRVRKAVRS